MFKRIPLFDIICGCSIIHFYIFIIKHLSKNAA